MTTNNMTADMAVKLIQAAIPAVQYLERIAQQNDNAEGKGVAKQVEAGEDVDLSRASMSFKTHKKVSKAENALDGAMKYGQLVVTHETKAKAIEAVKVENVKRITKETVKA